MKSFKQFLSEGVSDVLFHSTSVDKARKILESNQFLLVHSGFSKIESGMTKKGKDFFMSTARNRNSDYIINNGYVILSLDGQKLGQRYKGAAVDYWGPDFRKVDPTKFEQEDRIYSDKPKIPNAASYIKDISILIRPNPNEWFVNNTQKIVELAKKHGITVYFYSDRKAFVTGDKRKLVSSDEVSRVLSLFPSDDSEDRVPYSAESAIKTIRAYIMFFRVLEEQVATGNTSFRDTLTKLGVTEKEARDPVINVEDMMSYKRDFVNRMETTIHNARSDMTNDFSDAMFDLVKLMRKYKVSSFDGLYEKALALVAQAKQKNKR